MGVVLKWVSLLEKLNAHRAVLRASPLRRVKLICLETNDEEELRMLATKSPQLEKAVGVLKELSADERTRMLAEAREKARRDEVSRLNRARREGREEGKEEGRDEILELLKSGKSPEEIIREYGTE